MTNDEWDERPHTGLVEWTMDLNAYAFAVSMSDWLTVAREEDHEEQIREQLFAETWIL